MSKPILTMSPNNEINHAISRLVERRYSGAPVVDAHGTLIGMITQKDCFKAMLHSHYYHSRGGNVADYMSQYVESLDTEMSLFETAQRFVNSQYRRFPVLEKGELAGIVTRHDVLRAIDQLRQ